MTAAGLLLTPFSVTIPVIPAYAAEDFRGTLSSITSAAVDTAANNVVNLSFNDGAVHAKITFLEGDIFRYNVDPSGAFSEYAAPRDPSHIGRIQQYPDTHAAYEKPVASVEDTGEEFIITNGTTTIKFDKSTARMTVLYKGEVDKTELQALVSLHGDKTQGQYTDDSWNAFTTALNAAQAVLAKTDASQTEINDAKTALQNAVDGLQTVQTRQSCRHW